MRRTKTIFNRIVIAVMTALLSIALLPGPKGIAFSDIEDVQAGQSIDLSHKGSLKIVHYIIGEDDKDTLAPAGVTSHI